MSTPPLCEQKRGALAHIRRMLGEEDPDLVRQGCELARALADPALLAALAGECRISAAGRLIVGPSLEKRVRPANRLRAALLLVAARIEARRHPRPVRLILRYAPIGPDVVAALAQEPGVEALRELDLRYTACGDEGLEALARSPHLGRLQALHLQRAGVTAAGVRALAGSPGLAGLVRLDLRYNQIGEEGAELLANSTLSRLEQLRLHTEDVTPRGERALGRASAFSPDLRRYWRARAGSR